MNSRTILFAIAATCAAGIVSAQAPSAAQPCSPTTCAYLNTGLPAETRAADLVQRMTLDEKVQQTLEVAPAIMGTRPATTSIVVSITCSHSSCVRVGVSPVVPHGTRKSMPDSTCHATKLRRAASSMEPS